MSNHLPAEVRSREYLSVSEAAMLVGVSSPTVRRAIEDGRLKAVRLGPPGHTVRIRREALGEWLREVR